MPDSRRHRGPHPKDRELFAENRIADMARAVAHLSWLLTRGYAAPSALKLVGDRHELTQRQREAVARAACSDEARERRTRTRRTLQPGAEIWIDGFNLLLTAEVALGRGVVLLCRDGCLRDIASVHGTYRRVEETGGALGLVGEYLQARRPKRVVLVLDAPVSNSARLGRLALAEWQSRFECAVSLVPDADSTLRDCPGIVASADSQVLDACNRWVNLAHDIVRTCVPAAWIVDLSSSSGD